MSSSGSDRVATAWERLEGPFPASVHPDDTDHWIAVYGELVAAMDGMLEAARRRVDGSDGRGTAERREVELLTERVNFFRGRLSWWHERRLELRGVEGTA